MSVNNLAIEDVRALLNDLHSQVTGKTSLAPVTTADFISMAQATLAAGTDQVYGALMQQLIKTVFATRPYERKFAGLLADNERWGGILQKVTYIDTDLDQDDVAFHPVIDGQSVDQYITKKGNILVTRYVGSDVYQDWFTEYEAALNNAFQNEAQLGAFYAAKMQEISNKWEQYLETLSRTALTNFIAAKYQFEQNSQFTEGVCHLLTEYNQLTGLNLSAQDVYQEPNIGGFFRFVRARVNTLSRMMTNRSQKYQVNITGKEPNRHSPVSMQKIYLRADALDIIDAMVNTTTYHDEPLAYADVEGVDYWQSIESPDEIQVTPAIINPLTGAAESGTAQTMTDVFGVIFDQDAIVTNMKYYRLANTPLNARGLYFNTWLTVNAQYCNDLTEKGVVLLLD